MLRNTVAHAIGITGTAFYRFKMIDEDGRLSYSNTIRLILNSKNGGFVSPSVINNGTINIDLGNVEFTGAVEVVSLSGVPMIKRKLEAQRGRISIPADQLAPGIYMVKLIQINAAPVSEKILIQ